MFLPERAHLNVAKDSKNDNDENESVSAFCSDKRSKRQTMQSWLFVYKHRCSWKYNSNIQHNITWKSMRVLDHKYKRKIFYGKGRNYFKRTDLLYLDNITSVVETYKTYNSTHLRNFKSKELCFRIVCAERPLFKCLPYLSAIQNLNTENILEMEDTVINRVRS